MFYQILSITDLFLFNIISQLKKLQYTMNLTHNLVDVLKIF